MKVQIKKEFDGYLHIASCDNIPGCYVQGRTSDELMNKIKRALLIYKKNCEDRNQPIPSGHDKPVFNTRIRFNELSTDQLVKFFEKSNYHQEYVDEDSILLLNSNFPFNRIHLPRTNRISPLIIKKIFGEQNTIYVGRRNLKLNASVS